MATFNTNPENLDLLMRQIDARKLAIPDFQRDFVWDGAAIQDLLQACGPAPESPCPRAFAATERSATMASAFVTRIVRRSPRGTVTTRYRVRYRVGGRYTPMLHRGIFETLREAKIRRDWIAGELAAMRVPDLELLEQRPDIVLLRDLAGRWRESRIGVAAGTAKTYDVNPAHPPRAR
jgi:hypothetical protein